MPGSFARFIAVLRAMEVAEVATGLTPQAKPDLERV